MKLKNTNIIEVALLSNASHDVEIPPNPGVAYVGECFLLGKWRLHSNGRKI